MAAKKQIKFQVRLNPKQNPHEQATLDTLDAIRKQYPEVSDRDILNWLVAQYAGEPIQAMTTEVRLLQKLVAIEHKLEANNQRLLEELVGVIASLDLSAYVRDDGRSMHDEIGNLIPDTAYDHAFQGVYGATFDDDDDE